MGITRLFSSLKEVISKPFVNWYYSVPRSYKFNNAEVVVFPGVYQPNYNGTTKALAKYVTELDLNQKTVLELGAGAGLISVLCAQKNALVTASDINSNAIEQLSQWAREKELNIICVYSNLFENINFTFDYIFITPPYQPKPVRQVSDYGLNCGENFEYFETLFQEFRIRDLSKTTVFICLPGDAEMFAICFRAKKYRLSLKTVKITLTGAGKSVIYELVKND